MGRLRSDYERPLFLGISEEVVDLFGVDDTVLFRFSSAIAENHAVEDALYSEPSTTVQYKQYRIKCLYVDRKNTEQASDNGIEYEASNQIYVSLNHLLKAQVLPDQQGDLVGAGDVIGISLRDQYFEYDIIEVNNDGYINNSDKFTGYILTVKRRDKYISERKTGGPILP